MKKHFGTFTLGQKNPTINKAEIQIVNGKKLQKTQNRGRRKGSPLRHKQHYTSVYFPFKLYFVYV